MESAKAEERLLNMDFVTAKAKELSIRRERAEVCWDILPVTDTELDVGTCTGINIMQVVEKCYSIVLLKTMKWKILFFNLFSLNINVLVGRLFWRGKLNNIVLMTNLYAA